MDVESRRTAVVISKVEQVFAIVSHVGGTRYESHDQFTGNQPLKDVIHAETVLLGSYRRGLDVRFEIRVDGWFRFYHFSLELIVIFCFLYKRVTFLRRPGDTKVLFFAISRSLLISDLTISVACSTGVTILITGLWSLVLAVWASIIILAWS